MRKTLSDWNKYLEDLKSLRNKIYEGTETTDGLSIKLSKEECNIIWPLLNSEVTKVFCVPLEFSKE